MKCIICEKEDKTLNEYVRECDNCWYGMRLDPDNWIKKLKKQGIEVERSVGCVVLPSGIACGNPYKRKKAKKN